MLGKMPLPFIEQHKWYTHFIRHVIVLKTDNFQTNDEGHLN